MLLKAASKRHCYKWVGWDVYQIGTKYCLLLVLWLVPSRLVGPLCSLEKQSVTIFSLELSSTFTPFALPGRPTGRYINPPAPDPSIDFDVAWGCIYLSVKRRDLVFDRFYGNVICENLKRIMVIGDYLLTICGHN